MADNVSIVDSAGSRVDIAADDLGSNVKVQRTKLTFGVDGTATDTSGANPLPSVDAAAAAALAAVEAAVRALGATLGTPLTVRLSNGAAALDVTSNELHIREATLRTSIGATTAAAAAVGAQDSLNAKTRLMTTQLDAIKTAVELIDNAISGTGFNLTQIAGTAFAVNTGNASNGTQRVVLASDQPAVPIADNAAAGTGWSPFKLISANTTNATSVKRAAGKIGGWYISNNNAASRRYVKFFDKASAPTLGSDTPIRTIEIPPGGAANVEFSKGIACANGIAFAVTANAADSDTTPVAASEVIVNLAYA